MDELRVVSSCGIECHTCPKYKTEECKGCPKEEGKPFWIEYINKEVCPLYECCVKSNKLTNCGKCADFPCRKFYECKDPSITDAEHEQIVQQQVKTLKEYNS
jgi:hypothetical protein